MMRVDTGAQVWDCTDLTEQSIESESGSSEIISSESGSSGSTPGESSSSENGCVPDWKDCSVSRCCTIEGHKCFRKDDAWAFCLSMCRPTYKWENGEWSETGEQVWDCTE